MPREMKDSGIEWIGDIPTHWSIIKFKYVFDIIGGNGFPDNLQGHCDGDFPFCKVSDINGDCIYIDTANNYVSLAVVKEQKFNVIPQNSILIAKIGAALQKNHRKINKVECCIDNNTQALVPRRQDCIKYLYYITKCIDMGWFDNKGTIPSINNTKLLNFYIPNLELSEQKAIADFLDKQCAEIDSVIEQTKATIEEYKKLKQSVITEAVTKGIRGDRPMKDSGIKWIGEIPSEWDVSCLKRYCRFKTGVTPSTANSKWFEGDWNWFTPCDFNDNYYLTDSQRKLSLKAKEDGAAVVIPANTVVIIGIGGTAGKIGLTTDECSCNQQITALLTESVYHKYLMYWMIANTKFLKDTALYTTLPILNNETIGEYLFVVPTNKCEQEEIVLYLDKKCAEIDTLIEKKTALLEEMEALKKSTIFEYVTGKKKVLS